MPIHLPHTSRRQFLISAGAALVACTAEARDRQIDEDLVYLLNDTHVGEKHPPQSPVPSHLRQVVEELVSSPRKPACVLINGDLALKDGQPGDYRHFGQLIAPLPEAGIDVHLTMGNHDNREMFYEVLKHQRPESSPIASRHIAIVETPRANLFLLDSLTKTMVTQGTLGEQQLKWLARELDSRANKPALVVCHHNPRLGGPALHYPGGLIDSEALWQVFAERPQVKAYLHGHVHDRDFNEHQGIHIVNTLATSYVADPKTSTTGWTTIRLSDDAATFTTHTCDPQHPWNGQSRTLRWRS